jgi:hypothetical protein
MADFIIFAYLKRKWAIPMPVKVGLQYIDAWQESMEEQILAYEKEEVITGQIVFYGPSYFTRWSERFGMVPMREVLRGDSGAPCAINRGFGSSCAEHQLYYYPRAVRPLQPKVLVYSFTANGPSFGYTNEESWELAQRVVAWAECDFPGIHIYLLGSYPPRDARNLNDEQNARRLDDTVRAFCAKKETRFFLDAKPAFENAPRDVFAEHIHFNQKGYDISGAFFREALKEELEKF